MCVRYERFLSFIRKSYQWPVCVKYKIVYMAMAALLGGAYSKIPSFGNSIPNSGAETRLNLSTDYVDFEGTSRVVGLPNKKKTLRSRTQVGLLNFILYPLGNLLFINTYIFCF